MKRTLYQELVKWKKSKSRKPLILQGARQVGKTWLMKDFGQNEFDQTAYFNFESNKNLDEIFRRDLDPNRIIKALEIIYGKKINTNSTLIVFDEIQSCPQAITSLKYFYEFNPNLFILAAGSLLGIAIHQGISFPVGKVTFLELQPMGFSEFLSAIKENSLLEVLEKDDKTILPSFENQLINLLKIYFFVGGMPEVVKGYSENKDLIEVRHLQENILKAYENDFSKHDPASQLPRIRLVWQSIVGQLAKENSKFIYSIMRSGARAKEFEMAIEWLKDAGLIRKVTRITKPGLPLSTYASWQDFKIYLNDTGLLCAMASLSPELVLKGNSLFNEFKGILTEQYILQTLILFGYPGFYWNPENAQAEVDFVIAKNNTVIPIEVKSAENVRSRSLRVFYEKYKPKICIRTSLSGYKDQEWMTNIPLYSFSQWLAGKQSGSQKNPTE